MVGGRREDLGTSTVEGRPTGRDERREVPDQCKSGISLDKFGFSVIQGGDESGEGPTETSVSVSGVYRLFRDTLDGGRQGDSREVRVTGRTSTDTSGTRKRTESRNPTRQGRRTFEGVQSILGRKRR